MSSFKKNAMDIICRGSNFSDVKEGAGYSFSHVPVPFIPRWDLMFNSLKINHMLPDYLERMSYYDSTRKLGLGIASTRNKAYIEETHDIEVIEKKSGYEALTIYRTKFGDLTSVFRTTPQLEAHGVRGVVVEFPLKTENDFDAACSIIENTSIISLSETIEKEIKAVGEGGIVVAQAGYLPFHELMRSWAGYENFYFLLHDHPDRVEKILLLLEEKFSKVTGLLMECPADIITVDGHFSMDLIPPPIYENYFLNSFKRLSERLHKCGKFMCSHTDAEMKGLLGLFMESGFDIAESYTPPPMTSTSVADCFKVWGDRITIWGGLASIMFSKEIPVNDFEQHVRNVKKQADGKKFIAGIGDNAPTDGVIERLVLAKKILEGG